MLPGRVRGFLEEESGWKSCSVWGVRGLEMRQVDHGWRILLCHKGRFYWDSIGLGDGKSSILVDL